MTHARLQFADWLKMNHPALFQRAITIAENSRNNALGQIYGPPAPETIAAPETNGGSFWDKFTAAAMGLGTTYLTLKNQRDAMKINLERAQAGMPPIDMATSAPVIRTQVDLSPELTTRLMSTAGEGMQKMLIPAAIGLVALLFFMRK
jgi:hypothetical protein